MPWPCALRSDSSGQSWGGAPLGGVGIFILGARHPLQRPTTSRIHHTAISRRVYGHGPAPCDRIGHGMPWPCALRSDSSGQSWGGAPLGGVGIFILGARHPLQRPTTSRIHHTAISRRCTAMACHGPAPCDRIAADNPGAERHWEGWAFSFWGHDIHCNAPPPHEFTTPPYPDGCTAMACHGPAPCNRRGRAMALRPATGEAAPWP